MAVDVDGHPVTLLDCLLLELSIAVVWILEWAMGIGALGRSRGDGLDRCGWHDRRR